MDGQGGETYLDALPDGSFINDLKADVCDKRAEADVEQQRDQVPNAPVTRLCQVLQVDGEDQVEEVGECCRQKLLPDIEAEHLPGACLSWKELFDHKRHCADEGEQRLNENAKEAKKFALLLRLTAA